MVWHEVWTTAAIFVGVALFMLLMVLAIKNNRGGRHHMNRVDNRKNMEIRPGNNRSSSNVHVVYRDRPVIPEARNNEIQVISKPNGPTVYNRDEAMKIFGNQKPSKTFKEAMTSTDPLKVIFGSPKSGKTFNNQMNDTSALKMIFGMPVKKEEKKEKSNSNTGD